MCCKETGQNMVGGSISSSLTLTCTCRPEEGKEYLKDDSLKFKVLHVYLSLLEY